MSSAELFVTLVVALIVFGPSKLPMLARHLALLVGTVNRLKAQAFAVWQQQLNEMQLQENTKKAKEADEHYQEHPSKRERLPLSNKTEKPIR